MVSIRMWKRSSELARLHRRDPLPLIMIVRSKMITAINYYDAVSLIHHSHFMVDAKVIKNPKHPCGFMDIVSVVGDVDQDSDPVASVKQKFRLIYNANGHYALHEMGSQEPQIKLSRVISVRRRGGRSFCVAEDGHRVVLNRRVRINDTLEVNVDRDRRRVRRIFRVMSGNHVMVIGGDHKGAIGVIHCIDGHFVSVEVPGMELPLLTHVSDVFVIGDAAGPAVSQGR